MTAGPRRRRGSRLLLGLALFAGTLGAMYTAALLAGAAMDLLGVASAPIRLAGMVLALAAAIPVGFLLVERAFLSWSSRREMDDDSGKDRRKR